MLNSAQFEAQHPALEESKRMFHRVLASWAIDLVALRASGLDKPSARVGKWSAVINQDSQPQIRKAA